MCDYGFLRIAAAIPKLRVADCELNVDEIKKIIFEAYEQGVRVICFPELSVTAYTCGDLFLQQTLISGAEKAVARLLKETQDLSICFIIGAPVQTASKLYNCALVCQEGLIKGIVPKTHLPNYSEFYEKRWFEPATTEIILNQPIIKYAEQFAPISPNLLFTWAERIFSVEICEDVWSVIPPSSYHAMQGAQLIFNLSASPELIGKQQYIKSLIAQQSARCHAAYVYTAAGFGESTTDSVYAGNTYIYENGKLLAESERFCFENQLIISEIDFDLLSSERMRNTSFVSESNTSEYQVITIDLSENKIEKLHRKINPYPFIPVSENYTASCEEIFSIQTAGLAKRWQHTGAKNLIIGVSGGLDSTLALLACVKTADKLGISRKSILGVTMPGFGTTGRTYQNAIHLMQNLGVTIREISIVAACNQHFKDIEHAPENHDITYENAQARERTQILMDLANQQNGFVVGTGNLSELALGWATYNGDHISMYGVNSGIPKTLVRHLVRWVAETQIDPATQNTLFDILDTPVSPELLPANDKGEIAQFTEKVIGPYELHDFFLYYAIRYGFRPKKIDFLAQQAFENIFDTLTIRQWMQIFFRRFFNNQFKRSCMPDGPKVGSVNLSPRGDWKMPSDAVANLWLEEILLLLQSK